MQRKVSKLVFMSAGAALAWFLDPVSGGDRRRQVADQLSGLTGGTGPSTDPTGGDAHPFPTAATPPPFSSPGEDPVPSAVDAAIAGAKTPPVPADIGAVGDENRANLRTNW